MRSHAASAQLIVAIAQSTTCVNNAASYATFDYRWAIAIVRRRRLE
ncbi:hypothetical protein [Nostoc sp. CALU 1950]